MELHLSQAPPNVLDGYVCGGNVLQSLIFRLGMKPSEVIQKCLRTPLRSKKYGALQCGTLSYMQVVFGELLDCQTVGITQDGPAYTQSSLTAAAVKSII